MLHMVSSIPARFLCVLGVVVAPSLLLASAGPAPAPPVRAALEPQAEGEANVPGFTAGPPPAEETDPAWLAEVTERLRLAELRRQDPAFYQTDGDRKSTALISPSTKLVLEKLAASLRQAAGIAPLPASVNPLDTLGPR